MERRFKPVSANEDNWKKSIYLRIVFLVLNINSIYIYRIF